MIPSQENDDDSGAKHLKQKKKTKNNFLAMLQSLVICSLFLKRRTFWSTSGDRENVRAGWEM